MEKKVFEGNLTNQELINLKEANFSDKEIKMIQETVYKYRENLTGFRDLIGDKTAPSRQFLFNIKYFGYLLQNDPEKVLSKNDVLIRKHIIDKLVRLIGPTQLKNKQIFENRNFLKAETNNISKVDKDSKIKIPDTPVIWTPNHHFKDDVLASYLATQRQSYILFGSVPQFYNSFDGVLAHLVGSLMTNRKVSSSKQASVEKAIYASKLGSDILCFPEGIWGKQPNELLIDFWPGIYRIASETGMHVVPVVHYIKDPTLQLDSRINPIHTVVDDSIDISQFSEKTGLEYLRDVMATWYYLMAEKYGNMSREELIEFYKNRALQRNENLSEEEFQIKELTSHEAYELYMLDLLDTVGWYDSEIELSYDYRPKDKVRPEDVFKNIADIKNIDSNNISLINDAKQLIRTKKMEDYQRRF